MTANNTELVKKKALRHNEYYNLQKIFDELYALGKLNTKFNNLMDIIQSEENILLAYRNIKRNKGSNTSGTDGATIKNIEKMDTDLFVKSVRDRLNNFNPKPVRRVEIEKSGGGTRPLGIPPIEERIIQVCIKQVLEPIVESKFYEHSYGFRPDRGTHHAIARLNHLAFCGYHYVVDIDIRAFFDTVDHGKLLKQLWTLGIQDKKLIEVISRMLKAEIKGIGIPEKGTPQGGCLSPLLSNVVLNEFDHWISSQWDNFPTRYKYKEKSSKHTALRKTKLKDVHIVRFCDDFKIVCKDHRTAHKIFSAAKKWLKERLGLEINNDKSKITNLRKNYSEFLGFKLKVKKGKGRKYTNRSHLKDKAKIKAMAALKKRILDIKKSPTTEAVNKYNATVLGLHNYYRIATMSSIDFAEIAYVVNKNLKCRTKSIRADTGDESKAYKKFYGQYGYRKVFIANIILFPIRAVKFNAPRQFSQEICQYTAEGRKKIHDNLRFNTSIMLYLMSNPIQGQSTEYNDNRISLYAGQLGKCFITGNKLEIGNMEIHHKIPKVKGGDDGYPNLVFIANDIHTLIHATMPETIISYINVLKLDALSLKKLNKLRVLAGNDVINSN